MIARRPATARTYTHSVNESPATPPDALKAIALPLLAVMGSLLVSGATFAALGGRGDDVARTLAFLAGSATLAALGIFLLTRLPAHRRRMAIRGRRDGLVIGCGIGFALAILAVAIVAAGVALDSGARERLEEIAFELPDSTALVIVTTIAVVVLAPIGEELVFRALLLRELAGRIEARNAVLVSAAIFTAAHADAWLAWPRAAGLFMLGVGFALVYRRYGLLAAIGAHAAVNATAVGIVLARG